MTCDELRTAFQAYVDRELSVGEMVAVEHHLTFCMECQWRYAEEQGFRAAIRQKAPHERAPAELAARVRTALRAEDRGRRLRGAVRWFAAPVAVAALALLVVWGRTPQGEIVQGSPVVADLVAKHLMYSQLEAPAEVQTSDRRVVADWFGRRVRFEVPVPDFTPSGIRLLGGRLSELGEREVAYLLYEKGRNLISFFAFPRKGLALPKAEWITYDGRSYVVTRLRGHEVVLWSDGEMAFALVSLLARDALLDCAAAVFRERLLAPSGQRT
jgi:mycothiol system anti-sigma-R factor